MHRGFPTGVKGQLKSFSLYVVALVAQFYPQVVVVAYTGSPFQFARTESKRTLMKQFLHSANEQEGHDVLYYLCNRERLPIFIDFPYFFQRECGRFSARCLP